MTIESVSHDATLSALSLSGIDIGTFVGSATAYTASVAHDIGSTTVTATASHDGASVAIAPGSEVILAEGANEITVTVTAEDGETTETYTVTVTRAGKPLTARFVGLPETHDGETEFSFELHFSEELDGSFSYVTLRDAALEVTGGTMWEVGRSAPPSNRRWHDPGAAIPGGGPAARAGGDGRLQRRECHLHRGRPAAVEQPRGERALGGPRPAGSIRSPRSQSAYRRQTWRNSGCPGRCRRRSRWRYGWPSSRALRRTGSRP